MSEFKTTATDLVILFGCAGLYVLPSMIAYMRKHYALRAIMVLNIALGWAILP